jgi:transposase-like protein
MTNLLDLQIKKRTLIEILSSRIACPRDAYKFFPRERECRRIVERARWNGRPRCPHCRNEDRIYRINEGKIFKCSFCKRQFSIRVGTIFQDSALPIRKWLITIYLLTKMEDGIASVQLAEEIRVSQKTAWYMLSRIEEAVKHTSYLNHHRNLVEVKMSSWRDELMFEAVMEYVHYAQKSRRHGSPARNSSKRDQC